MSKIRAYHTDRFAVFPVLSCSSFLVVNGSITVAGKCTARSGEPT